MRYALTFKSKNTAEAFIKDLMEERGITAKLAEDTKKNNYSVAYDVDVDVSVDVEQDKGREEKEFMTKPEVCALLSTFWSEFEYQQKWLISWISSLDNAFWEHKQGHIPAINDAGKMEQALRALGLGDSYEVVKPTVYLKASAGGTLDFSVE